MYLLTDIHSLFVNIPPSNHPQNASFSSLAVHFCFSITLCPSMSPTPSHGSLYRSRENLHRVERLRQHSFARLLKGLEFDRRTRLHVGGLSEHAIVCAGPVHFLRRRRRRKGRVEGLRQRPGRRRTLNLVAVFSHDASGVPANCDARSACQTSYLGRIRDHVPWCTLDDPTQWKPHLPNRVCGEKLRMRASPYSTGVQMSPHAYTQP